MKQYHIITFGCQANLADSERIARKLEMSGYKIATEPESADLIVLNACSVRQSATNRVYGRIRELGIKNKELKIIIAGCVLKEDKKKLLAKDKNIEFWHPDEYFDLTPIGSNSNASYIPIMTGCDNFCTYCAVPYTRGRERSRPAKDITRDTKDAVSSGTKEIWLLGQNVNSYKYGFPELLKAINNISGDFKIHFMSSHPKDFSDKLIKTISESKKVSREIHLPVQSGDNTILKKMNRKYTISHYKNLIKKIRKAVPNIKISTDVIVGFPSETKKQFQNTVKLFKELKFSKAYIGKYSPRPGTPAAKMKDNIPIEEKKRRWEILNEIANPVKRGK
jgi:tRNA-2-methylthio-N6-dimethylallyladenosine synthase